MTTSIGPQQPKGQHIHKYNQTISMNTVRLEGSHSLGVGDS